MGTKEASEKWGYSQNKILKDVRGESLLTQNARER